MIRTRPHLRLKEVWQLPLFRTSLVVSLYSVVFDPFSELRFIFYGEVLPTADLFIISC